MNQAEAKCVPESKELALQKFFPSKSHHFTGGCFLCRHGSQAPLQCWICASSGWHHIELNLLFLTLG